MSVARIIALCALPLSLGSCAWEEPRPWTAADLSALTEEFVHIAEAYAVVDVCMPMLDADRDAKFRVVSEIDIRHYTQLLKIQTESELINFFSHHRQRGGTEEQYESIDHAYRSAHADAASRLGSVEICIETVSDYANTILRTNVRSLR